MPKKPTVTEADERAAEHEIAETFKTELGINNLNADNQRHYLAVVGFVMELGKSDVLEGEQPTLLDGVVAAIDLVRGDLAQVVVALRRKAREARRAAEART